jgi:DNA-binding transcriptional LysR family regulator
MLIRHLSYFVVLAREKHYGRAAEASNIAQPTLSAAIRKLEDDLQVHLVVRNHHYGGLTPDGEKVLEWGQRLLPTMRACGLVLADHAPQICVIRDDAPKKPRVGPSETAPG